MKKVPFPYQKELLDKAKTRTRLSLFWEMRLGKSLTAYWWLQNKNPKPQRILIICPKSVIVSWYEQLKEEGINTILVFDSKNTDIQEMSEGMPILAITNYETLTSKNNRLIEMAWDAIILDESTKIKNPTTKISDLITDKNAFPQSSPMWQSPCKNQYRVILTGTPAPESYLNYFQQFKFLYGKVGTHDNYFKFRKEYFYFDQNKARYQPKFHFISKFATFLNTYTYNLRRKDVGIDLPNITEKRYVSMSTEHRKIYDDFEENWFAEFLDTVVNTYNVDSGPSIKQLETQFATVAQSYLHQMACGFPKKMPTFQGKHKLNELIDIIENELDPSDKVVIWCQYLADIEAIRSALARRHTPEAITGGTTTPQLAAILERFRRPYDDSRACNQLICQIRKASMGMDLSAADTQIFFSRSWSALDNQQAIDRLVHPEKKNKPGFEGLLTIDIITQDTVDEDMYNALVDKRANQNFFKWFLKRTGFSLGKINASAI